MHWCLNEKIQEGFEDTEGSLTTRDVIILIFYVGQIVEEAEEAWSMPAYFRKVWNMLDAIIVLALSPYFLIKLKTFIPADNDGLLVHPARLLRMKPNGINALEPDDGAS